MLILDELKKNDPHLRLLAVALAGGLCILLTGLWWVQIVSAREYQGHLETQSYRTVRLPAIRGKILDREGRVLADKRPRYSLSLYLDDLRGQFDAAEKAAARQARAWQLQSIAAREKQLGRPLTKDERKQFQFSRDQIEQFHERAHFQVANAIVARISRELGQPLVLDEMSFSNHYNRRLSLPYPVVTNATPEQIARFEEQYSGNLGVDLDLQSVREYPYGTLAGHLIGYVSRDDSAKEGEDAFFNYYLPDYRGVVGVEAGYNSVLRGRAGVESVLVNNMGYRQSETILEPPEPGDNVVLTIDLDLQRAATESLAANRGADARGAVVVMDVRTGDVLAMVSSPEINPDYLANDPKFLSDPKLRPEINRATQQNYAPGSIFKPITALAALENGLDPNAIVDNPGYVMVGRRTIHDLADPGKYDLQKAIIHSCNTYFVTIGLETHIENIVQMAQKFHFGERTGLPTRQETSGIFPSLKKVESSGWRDGDSANICIGQGEMAVTPLQMAVAYAAIANGGTVLWPRLVEKIEDPVSGATLTNYPSGLVRDHLGVHQHSLDLLRDAMLAETEEGTGKPVQVPGVRICGKTGTAQVMDAQNREIDTTTWFASFAPYESPKYVVVVMVESGRGTFGGPTCGPIAHDIYEEILAKEHPGAPKTLARN